MTVYLDEHKLAYFAVPKVACTSIKTMFFEVENGFAFREFRANGSWWWIHRLYQSIPFDQQPHDRIAGHARFAVVRDPIRRLLSCYSNRVVHHRELSREKAGRMLRRAELPFDPDLSTFVELLPRYMRAVPTIGHHAAPTVEYLGHDAAYFDRVYGLHELDELVARVCKVTGLQATLPRLQTGGPKIAPDQLSPAEIDALREIYAEDYAVFGAHF